jgi:hypothetical protein
MNHTLTILVLLFTLLAGCTQSYLPPAIANPAANLVVEGFINNGSDSTSFTLSRTVALAVTPVVTPELNAAVSIQGTDNSVYPLGNAGNGVYGAILPSLNPGISYRIFITTGGKDYASDYVPLVANPPIDSINWVRGDTGIWVYANTHDPTNTAQYFRWDYTETWEFHSPLPASLTYAGGNLVPNLPNTTDTCWQSDISTRVILATSTQLATDVIYEVPLTSIPLNSQQLTVRYSIFIRQYALTKTAFTWWQTLQNNTENIGSIFGVEPTTNPGNLHCLTDTSETVVGYVSAGSIRTQRIFIDNSQVLPWDYISGCKETKIPEDSLQTMIDMGYELVDQASLVPPLVYIAPKRCVDCTATGSNIRPSFW